MRERENENFRERERERVGGVTWRSLLRSRVNSSVERDIVLTFIVYQRQRERRMNQSAEASKNPERERERVCILLKMKEKVAKTLHIGPGLFSLKAAKPNFISYLGLTAYILFGWGLIKYTTLLFLRSLNHINCSPMGFIEFS